MIYQLVGDRFAIGGGQTLEQKHAQGLYPAPARLMDWNQLPDRSSPIHAQHYGGDLDGVVDKLDYLADLGTTALYITPIHPAPSYHRYDATDYRAVADELGGMAAFERLVTACRNRGIKLIMDLVLNHVSANHPAFVAAREGDSRYRDWFYFRPDGSYDCWWGFKNMPELRLENQAVMDEFVEGPNSVLRFWADRGVDVFRLDCANDLGTQICSRVRTAAHAIDEGLMVVGEVFHDARSWLGSLDGVQSYLLTTAVYDVLFGRIQPRQFGLSVQSLWDSTALRPRDREALLASWVMVGSHDYPRPLTILEGRHELMDLALLLQFTLPGTPLVYYGNENGMTGGADPLNRAGMVWEPARWDHNVRKRHQELIALRANRPELRDGRFLDLSDWLNNGLLAYVREWEEDTRSWSLIVVNPGETAITTPLYLPLAHVFSDMDLVALYEFGRHASKDKLSRTRSRSGTVDLTIPPRSGAIYVADYDCKKGYRFSKRL